MSCLKLLLALQLLLKVRADPIGQVEKETKHLAKIVSPHLCQLAVHVRVVVENLEQVAHLEKSFVITSDGAALERLQDLLDGVFGVGTSRKSLDTSVPIIVFRVVIINLIYLLSEDLMECLLDLVFINQAAPSCIDTIKLVN